MTDDDLPLERESRDLPMSLLADGVAEHYGRRIRRWADWPKSAPDPADFIPPWPCQQLHGGRPPYIYQGCDPDTGLCHHEECNPANDDRVPNAESEVS